MTTPDLQTQLKRVSRDIAVQRRLKRQKKARHEDINDVNSRLDSLRLEARIIKNRMQSTRE